MSMRFPNVFACGDVAGPYQFTHAAAHQAWYAAVNGLFGEFKRFQVDYRVMPWVTFTSPEVARVGLSEAEAKEKGVAYEVTRYGLDDLDRAIAESEDYGFIKVLTPPGKDKILGAVVVGVHAGEILAEFTLAMKHGLGLNKILGTIHLTRPGTNQPSMPLESGSANTHPRVFSNCLRNFTAGAVANRPATRPAGK